MKEFIEQLFPPDVPPIARWRLMVFAAFVVIFFHIGWACGLFKTIGLGQGFAMAADVRDIEKSTKDVSVRLLSQDLFEAKSSECEATNLNARYFFQRRVLALSREYYEATRTAAIIPPCAKGSP